MNQKVVLENGAVIDRSLIDDTSICYKNVRLTKSEVREKCTLGDNSILFCSVCHGYNAINRNNYITDSEIGVGTYTGHNVTIKNSIIGRFCSLSWDLSIGGKNHDYHKVSTFPEFHWNRVLNGESPIIESMFDNTCIGNDVWIGSGAIILRGITVGDGAVIGAGAVVTKNVKPYTIVAGSPAKVIGQRFEDEIIGELLGMEWWNWSMEQIHAARELLAEKMTKDTISKLKNIKESIYTAWMEKIYGGGYNLNYILAFLYFLKYSYVNPVFMSIVI